MELPTRMARMSTRLIHGDCLDVLPTLDACSVDAVVCDPPYDLTAGKKGGTGAASVNLDSPYGRSRISTGNGGFMGKDWDATGVAFDPATWALVLSVMKPGAYLLAFGGTRTYHRLACAVEDAGFEIRDSISWLYGSGFPKSLNVGDGRGTALKPAHEPIVVARKSTVGTVAANVAEHGTGALNIDACRVATDERVQASASGGVPFGGGNYAAGDGRVYSDAAGRWPTNVVLDESQAAALDAQTGVTTSRSGGKTTNALGVMNDDAWVAKEMPRTGHDDIGGASRFFPTFRYEAKAPTAERPRGDDGTAHPTVKPLDLMRWLVRLVTPPGGTVLDPFLGSGTTAEACLIEGFDCIGIEREAAYIDLARRRIDKPIAAVLDFGEATA